VITNAQLQNLLANGNVVIATNNGSNPEGQNGDIFKFLMLTEGLSFVGQFGGNRVVHNLREIVPLFDDVCRGLDRLSKAHCDFSRMDH